MSDIQSKKMWKRKSKFTHLLAVKEIKKYNHTAIEYITKLILTEFVYPGCTCHCDTHVDTRLSRFKNSEVIFIEQMQLTY